MGCGDRRDGWGSTGISGESSWGHSAGTVTPWQDTATGITSLRTEVLQALPRRYRLDAARFSLRHVPAQVLLPRLLFQLWLGTAWDEALAGWEAEGAPASGGDGIWKPRQQIIWI